MHIYSHRHCTSVLVLDASCGSVHEMGSKLETDNRGRREESGLRAAAPARRACHSAWKRLSRHLPVRVHAPTPWTYLHHCAAAREAVRKTVDEPLVPGHGPRVIKPLIRNSNPW
jgi:hypothetical protein